MTTNSIDKTYGVDRTALNFENVVKESFAFLFDLGFLIIESLPTIVRYSKGNIQVDIYHGRQSYEVGLGITWNNLRYELADFIAVSAPEKAERYIKPMISTQEGLPKCLNYLAELTKDYCKLALKGDSEFFAETAEINKSNVEKYWLEMKVGQLRPQANEAFRLKKYAEAADLYNQIKSSLSPAELKKLNLAEERKHN